MSKTKAELKMEISTRLYNREITPQEANRLTEQVDEKPLSVKAAEKGGISVYGMQRFPTTLYPRMWKRLLRNPAILQEILTLADAMEVAQTELDGIAADDSENSEAA